MSWGLRPIQRVKTICWFSPMSGMASTGTGSRGRIPVSQSKGATITPQSSVAICDDSYTAYTQLAGGRELIKIDVHTKGEEEPESTQLRFDEIAEVVYRGEVQGDDYCSAIVLVLKDGRRVVYEDTKRLIFKKKAQELANVIGVPVKVAREDAQPGTEG